MASSKSTATDNTSYSARVSSLSPDLRAAFESACEHIERDVKVLPLSLSRLKALIPREEPLATLLAVHAVKCWIDECLAKAVIPNLSEAAAVFPLVFSIAFAQKELITWLATLEGCPSELKAQMRDLLLGKANSQTPNTTSLLQFHVPEHYELMRPLTDLGMGIVLLVKAKSLNRTEVLKALRADLLEDADARARFVSEPIMAGKAQHPGIVAVHFAGTSDGWPYFTMDYLSGGSLAERLIGGPIPPIQAATYIAIVARAADFVHRELNLVHRDIKPGNILFKPSGEPALADFGLARDIPEAELGATLVSSDAHKIVGTRGYIAPEILNHDLREDTATEVASGVLADVFSLGVTLYQCVTGKLPYQPADGKVSLLSVLDHDLVLPGVYVPIDPVLEAICVRAVRKRPAERFRSAGELAEALESWVSSSSRVTPPAPPSVDPPDPPPEPPKPKFGRAIRVAAVCLGLAAILAFVSRWLPSSSPGITTPADAGIEPGKSHPPELVLGRWEKSLREANWPANAAHSVGLTAGPWLDAVAQTDARLAETLLTRISILPAKHVPTDWLAEFPECAAVLAISHDPARLNKQLAQDRSQMSQLTNLLTRYPAPDQLAVLTALSETRRGLLLEMQRRQWTGAEVLVALPADELGADEYERWLSSIVATQDQAQAERLMAAILIQGNDLRLWLQKDSAFRSSFNNDLWDRFAAAISRSDARWVEYLAEPRVWKVLVYRGGRSVLDEYGPENISELLYEQGNYPIELHGRLISLLTEKRQAITEAVFDKQLRQDSNFHKLLGRDLKLDILSAACHALTTAKGPDRLELQLKLQKWDNDELSHMFQDKPHGASPKIYLTVSWRMLSGKRVYSDEWFNLFQAGVRDASLLLVLPTAGASAGFLAGFETGFNIPTNALTAAEAKARADAMAGGSLLLSPAEIRAKFSPQEASATVLKSVQQARGLVSKRVTGLAVDLAPTMAFFRAMAPQSLPAGRLERGHGVNYFLSASGRVVPKLRVPLKQARLEEFLSSRAELLLSETEVDREKQLRTWKELFSAWMLIQATEASSLGDLDPR